MDGMDLAFTVFFQEFLMYSLSVWHLPIFGHGSSEGKS